MWTIQSKTETTAFLRLSAGKDSELVRLDQIARVEGLGKTSLIHRVDCTTPFEVDQSVDEIVELIKKAWGTK